MSEWTVDIRVKVNTEDPAEAARICALMASIAVECGMPIIPQFVGVRPTDREPDAIDAIINGDKAPQALDDQAHGVFDGIMQAPPM